MFPPTWHQLTLHCGWQGPSAGGPPLVAPSEAPLDLAPGLGLGLGPPGANSFSTPGSAGGAPASSHPSPRPAANGSSHALHTQVGWLKAPFVGGRVSDEGLCPLSSLRQAGRRGSSHALHTQVGRGARVC